jgi:nucleoside-diphosphate-sugar epimerase
MDVLVTGATGFLGKRVAAMLVDRGHRVIGAGRDRERASMLELPVRLVDLEGDVAGLCDGVEAIVHCAGLSSAWAPYRRFEAANVRGTEHLLREAKRAGVKRFVHVSTSSVYARARDQYALAETSGLPRRPANDYVATKLAAEHRVRRAGIPYAILRPRGIFGPGDTSIFPRLLRALSTRRLPVIGTGETLGDLTYVDNVAEAAALALEAPSSALDATYNVTNAEPVKVWRTIGELAKALDLPPPRRRLPFGAAIALAAALELRSLATRARPEPLLTRYTVTLLGCTTTLDVSSAMRRLGYRPRVSMDEGLARFVAWWKERAR